MLEVGHIYCLNVQKLSKTYNSTKNSDNIIHNLGTLQNTIDQKSDKLCLIIESMHGKGASHAIIIM